jgi:CRP/FNR family transcriptional regulator, anaerobic regulatory protein
LNVVERGSADKPGTAERPVCDPALIEDLRNGARLLREAFMSTTLHYTGPDTALVRIGDPSPRILLIRGGLAVRSCDLPNGRRAIFDLFIAGDVCGLDHAYTQRPSDEITAAGRVAYHALAPPDFRSLLSHPQAALLITALVSEARHRIERIAAMIGRFDARARICALLLDIEDRLRHRGLVSGPSFPFPLTQEQIADHLGLTLVHVNRTLRRLRQEGLVLIERQVVTLLDPDYVRTLVSGLPQSPELPEPVVSARLEL